MLITENIEVFVKVVQMGNFSKAALALKLPLSTVSRRVAILEESLGMKLLFRTTRSVSLTSAGKTFFERVAKSIGELEEAWHAIDDDTSLSGRVKLTATEDLGAYIITPVIGKLMREYPKISVEMYYTTEVVDLVKSGFDLALRIGSISPSNFKSIRVGEITLVAVASSSYLDQHASLREPKDLKSHRCLTYGPSSRGESWTFASKDAKVSTQITARALTNHMQSLADLAAAGCGIAFVPLFLAKPYLDDHRLIRVLPKWIVRSYKVHLVSPHTAGMPARVKVTADAIASSLNALLSLK